MIKIIQGKKPSQKFMVMGFYPLVEREYAHLIEHIFVNDFLIKEKEIEFKFADIGAGFIRAFFLSDDQNIIEKVKAFSSDYQSYLKKEKSITATKILEKEIEKERDIIMAEYFGRKRVNFYEEIYRLIENNLSEIKDFDKQLKKIGAVNPRELLKNIVKVSKNINWLIINTDKVSEKAINSIVKLRQRINEVTIHLEPDKGNNDIQFRQIGFINYCEDEFSEIILRTMHSALCKEASRVSRECGVFHFYDQFFSAWGKRIVSHYSAYSRKKYGDQFVQMIFNLRNNLSSDKKIVNDVKREIRRYLKHRTVADVYTQAAQWGKVLKDYEWQRILENLNEKELKKNWQKHKLAEMIMS